MLRAGTPFYSHKLSKQRELGRTAVNRRVVAGLIENILEFPKTKARISKHGEPRPEVGLVSVPVRR